MFMQLGFSQAYSKPYLTRSVIPEKDVHVRRHHVIVVHLAADGLDYDPGAVPGDQPEATGSPRGHAAQEHHAQGRFGFACLWYKMAESWDTIPFYSDMFTTAFDNQFYDVVQVGKEFYMSCISLSLQENINTLGNEIAQLASSTTSISKGVSK
jgi:hypothetical protein